MSSNVTDRIVILSLHRRVEVRDNELVESDMTDDIPAVMADVL
jgi:hypothetical protein